MIYSFEANNKEENSANRESNNQHNVFTIGFTNIMFYTLFPIMKVDAILIMNHKVKSYKRLKKPLPLVDFNRKKFSLMASKENIDRNISAPNILYVLI